MRHRYEVGETPFMGRKKVTIEEKREFFGAPSYKVVWFDKENNLCRAVLKESELQDEILRQA